MSEVVYPDMPQDVDLEFYPDLYQFWYEDGPYEADGEDAGE